MDDVIIFSDTVEGHAEHLANVFKRFRKANLQLQPEKCDFAKNKVAYVGCVLSQKGIEATDDKIRALQQYLVPKSMKGARASLGLHSFCR
jgi:hypothetical protein